MKAPVSCAIAVALAGCSALPARVVTLPPQRVDVPVPVSCLKGDPPARPKTLTDAELAALDDYGLILGLRLNAEALHSYSAELEAVLKACR